MKIGSFAKKHNVTIDTVRHYLDLQLLVAEKDGSQYYFSQQDSIDIEEILELKDSKFTLNEIQNILAYKRLASNRTSEYRNHLRVMLEDKKNEVLKQQQELIDTLNYIDVKINELDLDEKQQNIIGFPLTEINLLECVHCKKALKLSAGTVENNMIISGELACDCGHSLIIEKGIIVEPNTIKIKAMPSKREYYEKTSSKFINFMYKSMATLINLIKSEDIKKNYILEVTKCSGFFILQYLPYLPRESICILIDSDFNRMTELKNNLELHHVHRNFIFLCTDYDKLPLKGNTIDLVIDSFASHIHSEKKGLLLKDYIVPLMKKGGYIGAIYSFFNPTVAVMKKISVEVQAYFNKAYILEMLEEANLEKIDQKENGPINEAGIYNPYVEGNDYYNLIYLGRK